MNQNFGFIPTFLAGFVVIILAFSMILWQRIRADYSDPVDEVKDQTTGLLLGLLLLAVFGLGAFVMYALIHFG
jgi:hypothetical protein